MVLYKYYVSNGYDHHPDLSVHHLYRDKALDAGLPDNDHVSVSRLDLRLTDWQLKTTVGHVSPGMRDFVPVELFRQRNMRFVSCDLEEF